MVLWLEEEGGSSRAARISESVRRGRLFHLHAREEERQKEGSRTEKKRGRGKKNVGVEGRRRGKGAEKAFGN